MDRLLHDFGLPCHGNELKGGFMKKNYILYLIAALIFFPYLIYSIIVVFPNNQWHGFGVDSSQIVYIGKPDRIDRFENCVACDPIPLPHYRTYYFTVQENDTILVSNATRIDLYSLSGTQIDTFPDKNSSTYNELQWTKKFQAPDGDTYRVKSLLGFRIILRNNKEIVYQTPMGEYMLYILGIFSILIIALSVVFMLTSLYPENNVKGT